MLQFIRDRATGWLAWAIITLICIPFALWGVYDYLSPNPTIAIATVNGTELSIQQYRQGYQRHLARLRTLFGASFDPRQLDESLLREQSLETMIQDELLVQASSSDGLRISDVQLARAINVQEVFQRDGKFSQDLYEGWLRSQGYSPSTFEYDLSRSLLTEQVLSGIAGSAITTISDKNNLLRLTGQKRSFNELIIPIRRYSDISVADSAVELYYEENRSELVTPETVALEYVSLSLAVISEGIQASEEELRSLYEASKPNYVTPERRRASHILLRLTNDADETAVAEAQAKMIVFTQQLQDGADFAELAMANSEDPGSAKNGGDLGYFERGDMDRRFEDAAFALQVGEMGEPVRTAFGFHVINLVDIKQGATKSFEDAREEVLGEYQQSQAEQIYFERVERLANLTFEFPDSLEFAAEELDLEIQTTEAFGREGDVSHAVTAAPGVVAAAFSEDVLAEGNNSDVIQLPDGQAVVVRTRTHESSRPQTFQEARSAIVGSLEKERAREQAKLDGEAALQKLRDGEERISLAENLSLQWAERSELLRGAGGGTQPSVLRHVFAMLGPGAGLVNYEGLQTIQGDYVIIGLTSVEDGEPGTFSTEQRDSLVDQLVQDYGRSTYDAYVQALREQAEIEISEEDI